MPTATATKVRQTKVRQTNSAREVDRRSKALIQAQRIQDHLPDLYRQLYESEQWVGDLRQLIADEKQAIKDLHFEAANELGPIHARYKDRDRRAALARTGQPRPL